MATLYEVIRFIKDDWKKYNTIDDLLSKHSFEVSGDTRTNLQVIHNRGYVAPRTLQQMAREVTAWDMCEYNQKYTINQYTKKEVEDNFPDSDDMEDFNLNTVGSELFSDDEIKVTTDPTEQEVSDQFDDMVREFFNPDKVRLLELGEDRPLVRTMFNDWIDSLDISDIAKSEYCYINDTFKV